MTLPNNSAAAADGSVIATHLIGAKEYPVQLMADSDGQLIGSRPEYICWYNPVANATSVEVAELFNAAAGVVVRVRGIWVMPTNTSITGLQIPFDVNRISAVGTGGTTQTPRPMDTTFPGLNASITARIGATGGATLAYKYWTQYLWNDEATTGNPIISVMNQLPVMGDRVVEIVLRQNEGVQVKEGTMGGTAAGQTAAMIYFVVDN